MTEAIYLEISSSIYGSHTFSSLLNNLQDTMLATMQDIKYQEFLYVSTTIAILLNNAISLQE